MTETKKSCLTCGPLQNGPIYDLESMEASFRPSPRFIMWGECCFNLLTVSFRANPIIAFDKWTIEGDDGSFRADVEFDTEQERDAAFEELKKKLGVIE